MARPITARIARGSASGSAALGARELDANQLIGEGIKLQIPGDNALMIEVR